MNIVMKDNFRAKTRALMKELGVTQVELGRRMGMTHSAVNHYLVGRMTPGLDVIEKFADALGVSPWQLLDDQPITPTAVAR